MQIKSGIWFGAGFAMGIYQKPFSVKALGLKDCRLSKLVLGQLVSDQSKLLDSYSHQIFANPELPSNPKRRAKPFGAGYTEYQPEIIFLNPFGEQQHMRDKPLVKLQHGPSVA